ncbi:restriction endonuclease subunit S [Flavobacterium sediminilitoris]|uniref:Restriction endonuclease subunit S n=1 Tax=Flavobacterium sediminilitoris TaxID=2024526 RepID=A0ABY4HMZ6_9FLAO|nr:MULTISPECIES: restriction endonuclease subunit S [Flavobacterium]UOX33707.1 restriction endonuclease subunit S [Flavobacterium sediminilitoris]
MEKNKPQIRFNGFSENSQPFQLGKICVIGDIDHRMPPTVSNGVPYLMTGDFIGLNELDFENAKLVSIEDYNQLSKKIKPELGDILFARYASIGDVRYVETSKNFLISYSCAIIKKSDSIFEKYLYYYFQNNKIQNQIELEINTGSQRNIGIDSIRKLIFQLPKETEQKKISTFFENLDKLITEHQQKHSKLKTLKKAMLSKMFPQQGQTVPEIRFKGFTGNWEEKKLGNISKITTGISNRIDSGLDGDYAFFDRSDDIRRSNIFLFDCEAIIVAGEGSDFIPKYFKGKFDLHQRTYAIIDFKNIIGRYLFYYVHFNRKHFLDHAVGSTVKSLRQPIFENMVIMFPKEDEQILISNYFKNIDHLIFNHELQINKLQNIKKAFLAKMFI